MAFVGGIKNWNAVIGANGHVGFNTSYLPCSQSWAVSIYGLIQTTTCI